MRWMSDEFVLSGTHACGYIVDGNAQFLVSMTWILGGVWEALALFLAIWIAVKHFRELPRPTIWAIGDCFTILVKSHVFYFARWGYKLNLIQYLFPFKLHSSFAFVTFLQIISNYTQNSVASEVYAGVLGIIQVVQMFVLGPRLILGVREYHARLVAHSDERTGIASVVFQERIQITTGGGV